MHCSDVVVTVAALAATSDAMVKDTGDNRGVEQCVVKMTTAIIINADEDRPRRIACDKDATIIRLNEPDPEIRISSV
jgi:hypothetical protein